MRSKDQLDVESTYSDIIDKNRKIEDIKKWRTLLLFIEYDTFFQNKTLSQRNNICKNIILEITKWNNNPNTYELKIPNDPIAQMIMRAVEAYKKLSTIENQTALKEDQDNYMNAVRRIKEALKVNAAVKNSKEKEESIKTVEALFNEEVPLGLWSDPDTNQPYNGFLVVDDKQKFVKLKYTAWQLKNTSETSQVEDFRIISLKQWCLDEKRNIAKYLEHLEEDVQKMSALIGKEKTVKNIKKNINSIMQRENKLNALLLEEMSELLKKSKIQVARTYSLYLQTGKDVDAEKKYDLEIAKKKMRNRIREIGNIRGRYILNDWNGYPEDMSSYINQADWEEYLDRTQAEDADDSDNDEEIGIKWAVCLAKNAEYAVMRAHENEKHLQYLNLNATAAQVSSTEILEKNTILAEARENLRIAVTTLLDKNINLQKNLQEVIDKFDLSQFLREFALPSFSIIHEIYSVQCEIDLCKRKNQRYKILLDIIAQYPKLETLQKNDVKHNVEISEIAVARKKEKDENKIHSIAINNANRSMAQNPSELDEEAKEHLDLNLLQPDKFNDMAVRWPELVERITRLRRPDEANYPHNRCGFLGCTEEGAVILREGPSLMYIIGWGSTYGTIRQIGRLWPDTEEENTELYAAFGLAGGMIGYVLGSIRVGYFNPCSRIAHNIFLSLTESTAIFIFLTGELITVYCNNSANWAPIPPDDNGLSNATSNLNITECSVSEATFAIQFALGPAVTSTIYLVFNTAWNLLSNEKKLSALASEDSRKRFLVYAGYATDYLLKSILFSRIFQYAMMSTYFSEAASYEWGALPGALTVAYIQHRQPRIRQRIYTGVLGLMGLVMLAQKIKTTMMLYEGDIDSSTSNIGYAYIITDILAIGAAGLYSIWGFRQSVKEYMLVEDSNPVDTLTLMGNIEKNVLEQVTKHFQGIQNSNFEVPKEKILELRSRIRAEVGLTYLVALRNFSAAHRNPEKVYIELEKCLNTIVNKLIDEMIELCEDFTITEFKSQMDNKHNLELSENEKNNPIKTNYFPRTRVKLQQPPPSPGIMLPAFKKVQESDKLQGKAKDGKAEALQNTPKTSSWRNLWGWKPF